MARLLIVGGPHGDQAVVELTVDYDDDGDGLWVGSCSRPGCTWSVSERNRQRLEDAVQEAMNHVDSCPV